MPRFSMPPKLREPAFLRGSLRLRGALCSCETASPPFGNGAGARPFDASGARWAYLPRAKQISAEAFEPMRPVVYDAGVLIAADRCLRRTWAEHRVRLEAGHVPLVPCPVVAQASRSPKQAQMRRLLRGCEVVPFDETAAHAAGSLLGKTRTRDVVDAFRAVRCRFGTERMLHATTRRTFNGSSFARAKGSAIIDV